MYQIIFYVPLSHLDIVKEAVFKAGAGSVGNYANCAWQILGKGQFCPLEASQPYLGSVNQLEVIDEYRVEIVCGDADIKVALQALLNAHPYETPAYSVLEMKTIDDF